MPRLARFNFYVQARPSIHGLYFIYARGACKNYATVEIHLTGVGCPPPGEDLHSCTSLSKMVLETACWTEVALACSKSSDSGERCEVKKAMKRRGGLGREVREPLLLRRFYFFALFFTSHRSPLSERLEQARVALSFDRVQRFLPLFSLFF